MSVFEDRFHLGPADFSAVLPRPRSPGEAISPSLFFEYRLHSSILMEEDIIKETAESVGLGLGVRVWAGEQTGYGYTNDLSPERMKKAARSAAAVASSGEPRRSGRRPSSAGYPLPGLYPVVEPAGSADLKLKIALVREAYDVVPEASPRPSEKSKAGWGDLVQHVTIVNSEGLLDLRRPADGQADLRRDRRKRRGPRIRFFGRRRPGRDWKSSPRVERPPRSAGRRRRKRVLLLDAADAPAGEMPVVLAAGHAGVLIHEAVGHLLEADFHRKKTSIFWNKMGARVGSRTRHDFRRSHDPGFARLLRRGRRRDDLPDGRS